MRNKFSKINFIRAMFGSYPDRLLGPSIILLQLPKDVFLWVTAELEKKTDWLPPDPEGVSCENDMLPELLEYSQRAWS